ncbi:EAL domain-containing protein [Gallaecimonas pentaromativorans]|uniref:EAL domain-containing protein n=1 Tax=Gallaecimonas pentaromativorans TaxID=584787 RepID=UPI003A92189D
MWRWLFGLLLVCSGSVAAAAANDVLIRQWTAQEGLPNAWVNGLLEDAQGDMWAGTSDGLFRLTQTKALLIPMPDGVDQVVNSLIRDQDGFYIGTSNALVHWSETAGLTTLARIKDEPLLNPGGINAFTRSQQRLWMQLGSDKLAYLQQGDIHLEPRFTLRDRWRSLASDNRFIYLLSVRQLVAFDPQSGTTTPISLAKSRYGTPKSLYVDRQGQLWLSSDKGLFTATLGDNGWQLQPKLSGFVRKIAEDGQGSYYLTGRYGIQRWSGQGEQRVDFSDVIHNQAAVEGLDHILVDHNGLVWAGALGEGVLALIPKATKPVEQYSRRTEPALASDIVWSIYRQPDGVLWLATDAGLERIDQQHQLFHPQNMGANDGFYDVIGYQGQIAVCGLGGTFLFDPASAQFSSPLQGTLWDGQACLGMSAENNRLLIGGADSLLSVQDGKVQGWNRNAEGKPLDSVKVFARQGTRTWAGGAAGLLYEKDGQWQPVDDLPGRRVNALDAMDDGSLLVGFGKEGVWRYEWQQAAPKWTQMNTLWELPNQAVYFLVHHNNRLYVGLQNMVARVKLDTQPQQVDAFFEEDGLPDDELNEGGGFITDDGTLWVGSASGVAAFAKDSLKHRQNDARSGVVYMEASTVAGNSTLLWNTVKTLQLPADLSLLSIQLGSQNYASKRLPHFRYQVSGQSRAIDLTSESPIVLGNLEYGVHQLSIWHAEQGRWRDDPEVLTLEVATPWYRSYGFFALLAALVILLALAFGQQRRRQRLHLQKAYNLVAESEHQLRLAMLGANVNTWTWDAAADAFTVSRPETETGVLVVPFDKMPIHIDDWEHITKLWQEHLEGKSLRYDVEHRLKLGEHWRWIHAVGRVVDIDSRGRALRVSGIYQDVTERKQLEGEINLYARAFENTAEGVLILSSDKAILSVNPAVERISGFDRAQLQDRDLGVLLSEEFLDTDLWQAVLAKGAWTGECSLRRRDGSLCALWLNISHMDDSASSSSHFVVVFSDMTERKSAEFELRRLANYDVLTGLPNRGLFMKRLTQALEKAQGNESSLALLFMDLDRFKMVNDTYGHRVGDGLLIEAASRLQEVVGEKDTVARLGGDEFVVIIQDISGPEQIVPLCESLLEALAMPFNIYGRQFFLSTSIGVSLFPDDGNQPEALLRNADMAMYHAKDEGRNNMQFYSHARNIEAMRLIQLESDLRLALERDEFFVVYQPQVDVLEGELVVAVEALVRWHHPREGLVNPDTFIKVAESCGLIAALDEQVLRKALQGISQLNTSLKKPLTLNTNISAAHFRQPDFVDQVRLMLAETGLAPHLLCLEITESTLMREVGTAREHLSALRALGVSVAVDDFGTGYSSLAYLKQFAVNELKVDKSFVRDLTESEADAAIVRSVVDLARNLGLKVVAEGVETEEQLDLCLALGCYRVQGYYYAKPMELSDLKRWLLDWNKRQAG